ncbi:M1 family metallopeptidase [Mariniflexile litorale]|uniref:Aminopeptidase N n=1 Tax=Mariniflexile litorale TaxID=3045158 RepID=A0AAU7EEL6_9FLAO|nr:M1 family metallopeptidase [Mariniflexile sp. KMM 9835]MDQ8212824.1 M1 family metallopeptidase [Mariniflexile sp. KMM 9835]
MNRFLFCLWFFTALFVQGQQTDYVDFKKIKAHIVFDDLKQKKLFGTASVEFDILKSTDSIYLDARNFEKVRCILNGKEISTMYDEQYIIIKHPFQMNTQHEMNMTWEVRPQKAMYFIDWEYEEGNKQIWTQGQGKYTSNWLPSIDDMNDKIEFDLSIEFDKNYQVIANGKLINRELNDSTNTWYYDMQKPMSSYLVALAIGNYDKKTEISKSGIPLEMYYYPEDSLKFEPTYRYTKRMFDFLEEEIGVPYPWQNYKQVPVKDFLYAGMENTSTTIFADSFVLDSIAFVDKNYVNVNAHELAHQWFGDLVTETSGTHHWLQEGFATYYALLAEKEVFGEDYYYWQLYEYAQELLEQDKTGQSTSLLNPESSSTTFYKKGTWVLHMLREQVGDKAFKMAVKNYLLKYQFKNVETDDFINEVEKVSGQDLNGFVKNYLVDIEFFKDRLVELSTKMYENQRNKNDILSCKSHLVSTEVYSEWDLIFGSMNDFYRVDFFERSLADSSINRNDLIKGVLNSRDFKVRQAIAINLTEIPLELREDYETLLNDKSYNTIEKALFNLWLNFPQERNKYLSKTKGIQGFNDKNLRILWLTLALITEDFEPHNKRMYFKELTDYTSPMYGFEIRQNAFLYLQQIKACHAACVENLKQATNHHSWQFSKFAKELLKVL